MLYTMVLIGRSANHKLTRMWSFKYSTGQAEQFTMIYFIFIILFYVILFFQKEMKVLYFWQRKAKGYNSPQLLLNVTLQSLRSYS